MATSLKTVMAKRKKILKAHPNMSNSAALKLAWKQARGSRVSGVKKKTTKKRKVGTVKKRKVGSVKKRASPRKRVSGVKKRVVRTTRTTTTNMSGMGAIKSQARQTKAALDDALGREMVKQYNATTKTEKRKVGKKVSEIKKQITSVKKIINQKSKK